MNKNVVIDRDINIKTQFYPLYELNKEYKSPDYPLQRTLNNDYENNMPVNVILYPPKNATKVLLRVEDKNPSNILRGPEPSDCTYSYMQIHFPDDTVRELLQNRNAGDESDFEYTFTTSDNMFQLDILKMRIFYISTSLEKETLCFFFTFK